MSKLHVLPKILKLRSNNGIVYSIIRHVGSGQLCTRENNKSTKISRTFNTFPVQTNRLIHTCSHLWKNTRDGSTKNIDIDEFRAEEVKLEREKQEKKNLENETYVKDQQSTSESFGDHCKIQKIRSEILEASLRFVPEKGWSQEAISLGAESINYPGVVHGMFPNGAIELIQHFYTKCNRELIEQLQDELNEAKNAVDDAKIVKTLSPREFAVHAIRLRIEMIIPYKDSWPQALAIMTLPQNVPTSLAQLLTLVDDICYSAGDRSVDIGWYTRRIGIASIYKMVELFLLQDKSPGYQQTWEFLERRMEEGIQIQEFLSTSDQKTKTVAKALGSAFQTARNILGLNYDKR